MNGEPLQVDAWARARQIDLNIFVQETHHARRLDAASYAVRDAETWDKLFSTWLISKGRVRGDKVRFLWAEPEGTQVSMTPDEGVVIHLPFGTEPDPQNPNVSETLKTLSISENSENFESLQNLNVLPIEPPPVLVRHAKKAKTAR